MIMNKHIVLQCQNCGAVLVINKKDYWHNIRCTHCDSTNILNIDEIDENEVKINNGKEDKYGKDKYIDIQGVVE